MKIYKRSTGQIAEPNADGKFVCGLKNQDNSLSQYKQFTSIADAAIWLCQNSDWGIRMNPGWSLIHRDIVIERN